MITTCCVYNCEMCIHGGQTAMWRVELCKSCVCVTLPVIGRAVMRPSRVAGRLLRHPAGAVHPCCPSAPRDPCSSAAVLTLGV